MSKVQRVGQEALEQVATTVAASFADDPIWKWLYATDMTLPVETGLGLARMLVAQSTPRDSINMTDGAGAVALWTAPIGEPDIENDKLRENQSAEYAVAFATQLGDRIAIAGKLGESLRAQRPAEPHWYLGILGTHPERQNQGLGSQLLQSMLARVDELGIPTFLESSNPRNYGFYERHGYTMVQDLTVDDSPPLRGYWRAVPRR